ncbi:hypothetical protein B0H21DRAFT_712155 [Amylocystis lapponica]|nr:hypothetical protein B0H21DRAFT_712155 [Amylocystis lapponica]
MPRVLTEKHRVRRQFRPVSGRTRFSPEHLFTPSSSSAKTVFAPELLKSDIGDTAAAPSSELPAKKPLIHKLKGEPGRLGRGGYTIKIELIKHGWTDKYPLATTHLDLNHRISGQTVASLLAVCKEATKEFLQLTQFNGCWPVREMIKSHLSNRKYNGKNKQVWCSGAQLQPSNARRGQIVPQYVQRGT